MELTSRYVRFGNHKIPQSTAIFNICSATDCPSRKLGYCQVVKAGKKCYALKAEEFHKTPLPFRRHQERIWDSLSAEKFADQLLDIVSRKRTPVTALRLNEAGDFRTQADVVKADDIAKILWEKATIATYCYTARFDLNYLCTRKLTVNGSGFRVHGEFKLIMSPEEKPKGYAICGGNCRVCSRCVVGGRTCVLPH